MRVPLLTCALCILLTPFKSHAQLSESDKTNAIQTIAKHLAEKYVDAEKGGQLSSYILTANFKGAFRKASHWDQFNEMVTKELQQQSNDKHIYVRRDAAIVREIGSSSPEMINSVGQNDSNDAGIRESAVLDNNFGYIKLSSINITEKNLPVLYEAMRKVENTDALIIDIRDNKGGGSPAGAVLESYFLPPSTPLLEFTSRDGKVATESTVDWLKEKKYDKPVFIIINKNTASAAEAFAFVMQKNKRATIVGETSSGAANRNEWFVVNDENYLSVSTATSALAGTTLSWQRSGVKPDIKVKAGDPVTAITNAKK